MKKIFTLAGLLAVTSFMLTGCQKTEDAKTLEYLAVKIDEGDSWSIIDKNGEEIIKEEYPSDALISEIRDGVFWVKQDDKWQLFSVSQPKKPLIDEEFTNVTDFHSGRAAISNPNEQICLIDTKGRIVARMTRDVKRVIWMCDYGYGVFVTPEHKSGVLDVNGKVVMKAQFAEINAMFGDYLIVKKGEDDKKLLIIDYSGHKLGEINTDKYELLNANNDGLITVREDDDYNNPCIVLDKKGKKVVEIRKSMGRSWNRYIDGYMAVVNSDYKSGVVDEKGDYVIRAKYSDINNLGHGEFAVQKGDKWGVVDSNDETILDFDYDAVFTDKLGNLYIVKDGSSWAVVGRDGKEMNDFDDFSYQTAGFYVDYIDVDGLCLELLKSIEDYEQPKSASQIGKKWGLLPENYRYKSSIGETVNIDDKITGDITRWYSSSLAEEKTHTERVDDGWFTYDRTVSDGCRWSNALPEQIKGTFTVSSDVEIDTHLLYVALCNKLAQGRVKISNDTFSKKVKLGKQTLECRISVGLEDDDIDMIITFRK